MLLNTKKRDLSECNLWRTWTRERFSSDQVNYSYARSTRPVHLAKRGTTTAKNTESLDIFFFFKWDSWCCRFIIKLRKSNDAKNAALPCHSRTEFNNVISWPIRLTLMKCTIYLVHVSVSLIWRNFLIFTSNETSCWHGKSHRSQQLHRHTNTLTVNWNR